MKRGMVVVAGLALLAVTACGTQVSYVQTNAAPHGTAVRQPHEVTVYTAGPPDRDFVELGYFEAEEGTYGGFEATVQDLRADAAARGCEGLIVTNTSTSSDYDPWVGMRTERRIHATCVVFPDASAISR